MICSLSVNVFVINRAIKFARLILTQEQAIEESLDGINDAYANVGKILQLPLATNDPKVIQIHRELKRTHDYILYVANRLTDGWSNPTKDNDG